MQGQMAERLASARAFDTTIGSNLVRIGLVHIVLRCHPCRQPRGGEGPPPGWLFQARGGGALGEEGLGLRLPPGLTFRLHCAIIQPSDYFAVSARVMGRRKERTTAAPAANRGSGLTEENAAGRSPSRLSVVSWALYDLANTVFSMNIVSLYFSLWVVNVMGGTDADYGNAVALSMAFMLVSAPVLGALSDQAGRRMPFLVFTTLACVGLTALLGLGGLKGSLIVFVGANYMFQAGLIFYDSLLPVVSTEENRGRIGGLGIGLGYLGSVIGVVSGLKLLDRIGYVGIFRLSALLFLVFAIPCFLFVRESAAARGFKLDLRVVWQALQQVSATIPRARKYPGLLRFLVGRFFYTDPANTIIAFMSIYVTNEIGFDERQAQVVLLAAILCAVVGGLAWGFVVDRIGPRRTLTLVLILWISVLTAAIATPMLDLPSRLFWGIACLAGIALGGLWTADRPLMLRLSPPKHIGEFYGLYSMIGRFGAVVGPFTWGLVVNSLGLGRLVAVGTLLGFMLVALVMIWGIDDRVRDWPQELAAP